MKCPQQTNVSDCGVYAVKFKQCLIMEKKVADVQACRMRDHRLMLADELLWWDFSNDQKYLPITCCTPDPNTARPTDDHDGDEVTSVES